MTGVKRTIGLKMTDERLTPREEFESVFGLTTDHQWQWLKEFVERTYVPRHGPSESMERYFEDVRRRHEETDEQQPLPFNEGVDFESTFIKLDEHVFRNIIPYELSLDKEPNAFGYGVDKLPVNEEGD